MSPVEERTVYQGEEPELFKKIAHAYAESGSWANIDGKMCIVLKVVPHESVVIVERLEEP